MLFLYSIDLIADFNLTFSYKIFSLFIPVHNNISKKSFFRCFSISKVSTLIVFKYLSLSAVVQNVCPLKLFSLKFNFSISAITP